MYDNNGNDINNEEEIEFSYDKPKKHFFKNLFKKDKKEKEQPKKEVKEIPREKSSYKPVYEKEIPVVNDELVRNTDNFNIHNSVNKSNNNITNNQSNNNKNEEDMGFNYYFPEPKIVEVKEEPVIKKNTAYTIMGILLMVGVAVLIFSLMSTATKKYEINVGLSTIALRSNEGFQIPFLTSDQSVTKFVIENSEVASVNSTGFIQANELKSKKKYVETKIKVGSDTINKTITLYVFQPNSIIPIENFEVPSSIEIKSGKRKMIEITNIAPPNNTQTQKYIFESSDSGIASVDSIGIITANRKGETTIKVKNTSNQEINKIIEVKVK